MVKLGVTVRYDKFADRILTKGIDGFGPILEDDALHRLWITMSEKLRFNPPITLVLTVLKDTAHLNGFHPVCDYLDSWFGTARRASTSGSRRTAAPRISRSRAPPVLCSSRPQCAACASLDASSTR